VLVAKPKAIIFDWDNTLIDNWKLMHASINHTFEQASMPTWSMEEVKSKMHGSMREYFPTLFGERYAQMRKVYYEYYMKHHLQFLTPFDGVVAILKLLHEQGIFSMLVSNKHGDILRKEVAFLHWDNYFHTTIGAEDTPQDKPSAIPAQQALKNCNFPVNKANEVWFVGDTIVDMQCAVNTGCQPVLFGDSVDINQIHKLAPNFYHVHNHYELLELLCRPSIRITA
jgi:phosphoglycolate phosphatase